MLKERFLAIKKNYDINIKQKKTILQNLKKDQNNIDNRERQHSPLNSAPTTCTTPTNANKTSNLEMNDNVKKVIKLLLNELRSVYNALIKSSNEIEKVFKLPLYHLTDDKVKFNFEDIHREEFSTALIHDEFIKVI
jgi:hypothetical protein